MAQFSINLDMDKSPYTGNIVRARTGDLESCVISATVYAEGQPYSLSGKTAHFCCIKPDGTFVEDSDCSVSNSTITYTLNQAAEAAAGIITTAYFDIYQGSTVIDSTQNFTIEVLLDAQSAPQSDNYVDKVEQVVNQAEQATQSANTAAQSANTAAQSATTAATNATNAANEATNAAGLASAYAGNQPIETLDEAPVLTSSMAYAAQPVSVKVYGNTRQNLWDTPIGSRNGITISQNSDGSMHVSGTSTSSTIPFYKNSYAIKPSTTYTFSYSGNLPDGCGIYYSDKSFGWYKRLTSSVKSCTFQTLPETSVSRFYVVVPEGTTIDASFYVMFNEGETAEPWCPPGLNSVSELALKTFSKNLFYKDSYTYTSNGVTFKLDENGSLSITGTATITSSISSGFNISCLQHSYALRGKTLTISANKNIQSDNGSYGSIMLFQYGKTGAQLSNLTIANGTSLSQTFTVKDDFDYFWVSFFTPSNAPENETYSITDLKIQLEIGSAATEYEMPQFKETAIDLQGNELCMYTDGTRSSLSVNSTGLCSIAKSVGYIASYSGEPIGDNWIASSLTADGTPATGAQVIYKLDEQQTVDLGTIELPALTTGNLTAWVDTNVPTTLSAQIIDNTTLVINSLSSRIAALELAHSTTNTGA